MKRILKEGLAAKNFGNDFILEVKTKNKRFDYSTFSDFLYGMDLEDGYLRQLIIENNGEVINMECNNFNLLKPTEKFNIDVVIFKKESDCKDMINSLYFEDTISTILFKVRELEKRYSSKKNRDRHYIKNCYKDEYVLNLWEDLKFDELLGVGFRTFESFLLDYVEQELISE